MDAFIELGHIFCSHYAHPSTSKEIRSSVTKREYEQMRLHIGQLAGVGHASEIGKLDGFYNDLLALVRQSATRTDEVCLVECRQEKMNHLGRNWRHGPFDANGLEVSQANANLLIGLAHSTGSRV